MKNILFFGDSLTAGYGLGDVHTESFPALIQQKIDREGLPYHVINAGISGDTSTGGLNRLDYWLKRPLDIFVLELGINDIMRGVAPEKIYQNLQLIIATVKKQYPSAKIALMGMAVPAFIPSSFIAEFGAIYGRLARDNQLAFLPFFLAGVAGQPGLNLADRLHPNSRGYEIIAGNVWPVLKPLLNSDLF